jgi:hypothetical protein
MPDINSFDSMFDIDLNNLMIFLRSKALRTAITIDEFIQTTLAQGATKAEVKAYLLKDLEEGGRIFGEFRNAIKATSNGFIANIRDTAQYSEDVFIDKWLWVAVLTNTCPDCLERHAKEKTMEEWEQEGLPRSGFTVCKQSCQCILIPADNAVLKPIDRGKASKAEERVTEL